MDLFRRTDVEWARERFPWAGEIDDSVAEMPGGRTAGLEALRRAKLGRYGSTRNYLSGNVTRLSPYVRHGLVSLAEIRDAALERHKPWEVEKLISELGWRDYYQRLYLLLGDRVWTDLEPYKTGLGAEDYAAELPEDISAGETGLGCMDAFARELRETGYLHNHARMWWAAYVVHHRRVRWQAGARWFLTHLLDGDPASNNLSFQWVASTFSHKPYFFNRENLERYTENRYCPTCPARGKCPFAGEYETVAGRLFPGVSGEVEGGRSVSLKVVARENSATPPPPPAPPPLSGGDGARRVVWAHEDALSWEHPAYVGRSEGVVVTMDEPWMQGQGYSLKRVVFLAESVSEFVEKVAGAERSVGDAAEVVEAFAEARGAEEVVVPFSPSPRIRGVAEVLARTRRVVWVRERGFARLEGTIDLGRFSRYWRVAEPVAKMRTPDAM